MKEVAKTTAFQLKILQSKFEEATITIGESLAPAFGVLNETLQGALDWFNQLSPASKEYVAISLAVATAVAGITTALAALVVVLPAVIAGFSAAAAPIALFVAGLAGGILIIGLFKDTWARGLEGISQMFETWVNDVLRGLEGIYEALNFVTAGGLDIAVSAIGGGGDVFAGIGTRFENAISDVADTYAGTMKEIAKSTKDAFFDGAEAIGKFVGITKKATEATEENVEVTGEVSGTFGATEPLIGNFIVTADAAKDAGEALEDLADSAGAVVDAPVMDLGVIDTGLKGAARTMSDDIVDAGMAFSGDVVSAMGTAGEFVTGAMKGFEAGGPIGAIIGIIATLLMKLETIMESIDLLNEGLDGLISAISPLFKGIVTLNEAVNSVLLPVFEQLGKIFDVIGSVLETLNRPLFNFIEALGKLIGPIFEVIAELFEFIGMIIEFGAILDLLNWTMMGFSWVMGEIGKVFTAIADELDKAFQEVDKAFQEVFREIDKFLRGIGINSQFARAVEQAEPVISGDLSPKFAGFPMPPATQDTLEELPPVLDDLNTGMVELAATVEDVNEELTNIPAGFKVALARFQATEVDGGDALPGGVGNVVNIYAHDVDELDKNLRDLGAYNAMLNSGTPLPGASEFGTDRRGS
jgi:phage-related protein